MFQNLHFGCRAICWISILFFILFSHLLLEHEASQPFFPVKNFQYFQFIPIYFLFFVLVLGKKHFGIIENSSR